MLDTVGITEAGILMGSVQELKRNALMFDRIGIIGLEGLPPLLRGSPHFADYRYFADEIEYLVDSDLIFDARLPDSIESDRGKLKPRLFNSYKADFDAVITKKVHTPDLDLPHADGRVTITMRDPRALCRFMSTHLRLFHNTDAYVIHPIPATLSGSLQVAEKSDVFNIIIEHMPVPDELTTWQEIREFRSDTDTKAKMQAIRVWAADVAAVKLTAAEANEKLEYLIARYEEHLQLHNLKIKPGSLETVIVGTADLVEDAVKVNAGKLAKRPFRFKHRRVDLMLAESAAPGRELSYILSAREEFGR